jgi:hypothetical protein
MSAVTRPEAPELLAWTLSGAVRGQTPESIPRRPGAGGLGWLDKLQWVPPALRPRHPAKPLPPQALVELLKHPFCLGEAQRVVLDALASTSGREFADLWEFVAYAQEQQKQLDLLKAPDLPARPARPPGNVRPPVEFSDLPFKP